MADEKEKLVEEREEKLNAERQKIDTFSDFGNMYNFKKDFNYSYKTEAGLTEDIVREISEKKHEPQWMLDFRLKSLDIFNHMEYPDWGPDISELDMDNIVTYVRPNAQMKADWNDVPDDIKDTFDRLGIPEAEKTSLAGVGAQYDSADSPAIKWENNTRLETLLASTVHTLSLPSGSSASFPLAAQYQFGGTYSKVELPVIECGGTIELSR